MAYATVDDWLLAEEAQAHIGDVDGDGAADRTRIDSALAAASAEMDGWLARRYPVPVADPAAAATLRVHALYVATFHLARTGNVVTEEIRDRYQASIAYLKSVSKGEADLPVTASPAVDPDGRGTASGDVRIAAPPRLFSRDTMKGW